MATPGTGNVFTFSYVNGGEVMAMGIALPVVCIVIVGLRFLVRHLQKQRFRYDDWFIGAGLLMYVGMGICLVYGAAVKVMGYATPPFPAYLKTEEQILAYNPPSTETVGKLQFAFQLLMMCCYGCTKIGICFFYRRIFVVNKRTLFDWVTRITIVVVFLWTITFILIVIFPCGRHVYANWGPPIEQEQYCLAIGYTSEEGLTASDLILDVWVILLPLPSVWALHMTTAKKLAVSGIFLLGASSLAASITRLVLYVQIIHAAIDSVPVDQNQAITLTLYWSALEAGLAVIAACLPTLSYLFSGYKLQSALTSMRSRLSLRSSSSGGSWGRSKKEPTSYTSEQCSDRTGSSTTKEKHLEEPKSNIFASQDHRSQASDVESQP